MEIKKREREREREKERERERMVKDELMAKVKETEWRERRITLQEIRNRPKSLGIK